MSSGSHEAVEGAADSGRKRYPCATRKVSVYVTDAIADELTGAENRSARLDAITRNMALMRAELCPSLSLAAWGAVLGVTRSPLPDGVANGDAADVIADRLASKEEALVERLGIDVAALVKTVRRWTTGQTCAVLDVAWRFWRMPGQLGTKAKLDLLGVKALG